MTRAFIISIIIKRPAGWVMRYLCVGVLSVMTQFLLLTPGINPLRVWGFCFHWVRQTVQESTWDHQLHLKSSLFTHTMCAPETQQSETHRTAVHYNGCLTWSFSWWRSGFTNNEDYENQPALFWVLSSLEKHRGIVIRLVLARHQCSVIMLQLCNQQV